MAGLVRVITSSGVLRNIVLSERSITVLLVDVESASTCTPRVVVAQRIQTVSPNRADSDNYHIIESNVYNVLQRWAKSMEWCPCLIVNRRGRHNTRAAPIADNNFYKALTRTSSPSLPAIQYMLPSGLWCMAIVVSGCSGRSGNSSVKSPSKNSPVINGCIAYNMIKY